MSSLGPSLLLLLTAVIWGAAFVAQRLGMDHVGPFAFTVSRNLLGVLALAPVLAWRRP
ncbi:MAG: EamA family transporter, partial [Kiritimatiellae bacterium]|nr:EamA family transporter [Kiritimatiellia bacterium]